MKDLFLPCRVLNPTNLEFLPRSIEACRLYFQSFTMSTVRFCGMTILPEKNSLHVFVVGYHNYCIFQSRVNANVKLCLVSTTQREEYECSMVTDDIIRTIGVQEGIGVQNCSQENLYKHQYHCSYLLYIIIVEIQPLDNNCGINVPTIKFNIYISIKCMVVYASTLIATVDTIIYKILYNSLPAHFSSAGVMIK